MRPHDCTSSRQCLFEHTGTAGGGGGLFAQPPRLRKTLQEGRHFAACLFEHTDH